MDKINIGIRYCGGCNPKYDRVKYVNELIKSHPDWNVLYMDDIYKADTVYLINGCERACARKEDLQDKTVLTITNLNL